jgi:peptidyl-prolyl cis-trans isomerase SurA
MNYNIRMCAFLVVTSIAAPAQVASHAPIGMAPDSAAKVSTSQSVAPQVSDKPVAKVNGVVLTDRDLLREMYTIFPYARQHNGFPKEQEASIRQGALEMIIFEELVYQEGVRRKMTIPPSQLQEAEADFKRQFGTPDQYREFLKVEMHGNPELVRQKIRRSLMIEKLLEEDVESKSSVSVAEAKDYYDKNPQRFQVSESFSLQNISILPPRDQGPGKLSAQQQKDIRKRAEEALRQAKTTKSYQDFGLLAEKISEDDFRVNMGDHKMVKGDELPPNVLKVLENMKPGTLSDIIQVQNACTIIRLNAHNLPQPMTFEQVKAPLQQELQKEKYEHLRSNLAKQLRAKAKIEVV